MTNREKAISKLDRLTLALNDCGIETTMETKDDCVSLYAHFWNCKDGSIDRLEVWAVEDTDYDIESCINPVETVEEILKNL